MTARHANISRNFCFPFSEVRELITSLIQRDNSVSNLLCLLLATKKRQTRTMERKTNKYLHQFFLETTIGKW